MTVQYVLVVEDNAMNADILRENLVDAGYTFALAVNGAAGVAIANELLPDIILMDVNLPILDGLSATRLLKKNTSTQGIPILALTARAMSGDQEMCLAAGCDDYVSKPVDIDTLLAKMKKHLDHRPTSFVEMIRRQRIEAETHALEGSLGATFTLKPGMAPRDYEDEFSTLNGTVERMEANLRLAQLRIAELDDSLAEREQQVAAVIEERDASFKEAAARTAKLLEERDHLRAERDALQIERDALAAGREPVSNETSKRAAEDLERSARRSRKLAQQLEQVQQRAQDLQQQLDSVPTDIRMLQVQHDSLRKAFLQLHRAVLKSAEEALHQVAFGGS